MVMSGQSSASKPTNRRRRAAVAGALALLIGLALAGVRLRHWLTSLPQDASPSSEPADPRRAYDGPYRNIHPDVHYVGDGQCTGCHESIAQSYAHHPMGRSLVPAGALLDRQVYTSDANNPFTLLGRRFEVGRQGEHLWHRQALLDRSGKPVVELSQEVHWVMGSGAKGYSYLTEQDGYLLQTAISWFSHQHRWDLSPGFGPAVLTGRRVSASCLFCHANGVHEHPEQPDRFVPPVFVGAAIGCERCHGPGELHVRTSDRWDIVNPGRLPPPLRDAVCEQCHLEGEARIVRGGRKLFDFRPGLPLHDFWAVLVQGRQSGEDAKAVNHVEQMYQSKCFSRPVGGQKLGCVTCHDPHVAIGPAERPTYYRARCLKCHDRASREVPGCSEPLSRRRQASPADVCIDCHMPHYRSSDIAHTASTDHRIVRRPTHQPVRATDLDRAAFVDFYRDRFPAGDPQTERNLGLGLVKMMDANMLQPQRHGARALRLLESALANNPSDIPVRAGKVELYLLLNRPAEALSEAQVILPERPGDWSLLAQAAHAAQASGQTDLARDYLRQSVAINPLMPENLVRLVELLIQAGQLEEAHTHCEQFLRRDPFNVAGRQAWVELLVRRGQRAEAQRAFEVIRQLKPPDLAKREEWFQQQMR
jgi:Flp pilus assembly protein TadD